MFFSHGGSGGYPAYQVAAIHRNIRGEVEFDVVNLQVGQGHHRNEGQDDALALPPHGEGKLEGFSLIVSVLIMVEAHLMNVAGGRSRSLSLRFDTGSEGRCNERAKVNGLKAAGYIVEIHVLTFELACLVKFLGGLVDLFKDFHGVPRFCTIDRKFKPAIGAAESLGTKKFCYGGGYELSTLGAFQTGRLLLLWHRMGGVN